MNTDLEISLTLSCTIASLVAPHTLSSPFVTGSEVAMLDFLIRAGIM